LRKTLRGGLYPFCRGGIFYGGPRGLGFLKRGKFFGGGGKKISLKRREAPPFLFFRGGAGKKRCQWWGDVTTV